MAQLIVFVPLLRQASNMYHLHAIGRNEMTGAVKLTVLEKGLARLNPAYFALVMATGIVSLDCRLFGLRDFSYGLFSLNIVAYCVLLLLYALRLINFREEFIADCFSHSRAFGFFTIVAATNVLGSQFLFLQSNEVAAQALWWCALLLWCVCTYTLFVCLIVSSNKPTINEGVNGGWLIAVVATQSLCLLGSQLKITVLGSAQLGALLLLSFWLFGGMLYLWLISIIFYRYMFFKFEPSDLIPPYWINMGAMAISTVAGCELIFNFNQIAPLSELISFVKGVAVLYWATATWWIPMLLVLGVWRHGIRKVAFRYDPLYWGLVFPLGMYSVCTYKLAIALAIPQLKLLALAFLPCAVLGWAITFLSMAEGPVFVAVLAYRAAACLFRRGEKFQ
jgi:tellurite resistance protein TehA-like permease